MTDIEPFSKSQKKQNAKDITDLGNQLAQLSEAQLSALPYPEIEAAIKEYKRITKGNARKRQMLYIGKLIRQVDLAPIEDLIDRYDSSSDTHRLLVHQFESWRLRLLASDPLVITELGERYPALDRQALRTIVRDAQAEQAAVAEGTATKAYRKLFQHLKRLHDQQLLADATMGAPSVRGEDLEDPAL
ncbi:MAG: DUF615 domain-containing protein [Gammaproteobacteria bacterium]|jgi:ribosome-associated protein|nr:DUF615 domain-containing protein [Gammaproteobacteria bacterium]MDB2706362.1 DUF615 domain-containing protein [Pseudomonadales bacterium]